MENKEIKIGIISDSKANKEKVETLTRTLRDELLEVDNITCEIPINKNKPKHTKGADAFVWGQLVLTLLASGGVVTSILSVINSWLKRNDNSKILIQVNDNKIELTGRIGKEKADVLNKWMRRYIEE